VFGSKGESKTPEDGAADLTDLIDLIDRLSGSAISIGGFSPSAERRIASSSSINMDCSDCAAQKGAGVPASICLSVGWSVETTRLSRFRFKGSSEGPKVARVFILFRGGGMLADPAKVSASNEVGLSPVE